MERKLNTDIPAAVSELELLMKKLLPKNIMYQLLLGKGLEFDGFRDYNQTDDSSLIDWKASVRGKKLLVRKYIEERDLKFIFIIDVSDNMVFGSTEKLKCEYVAELTAAVSHLILATGDRVGFFLHNDKIIKGRLPELGTKQFEIMVYELTNPENYGGKSDLKAVLESLIQTLDRGISMVFLISDFIKVDEDYEKTLESLSNLFETAAIIVRDPLDRSLPDVNKEIVIENPETRDRLLINPKIAKNAYEENAREQLNLVKKIFQNSNIDFLELHTDKSFSVDFANFIKERIKGGRIVKIKNVY